MSDRDRSDRDRDQSQDDMEERVRQASGGEPESGVRAESGPDSGRQDRGAAGGGDTPEVVREEDSRAATERVERLQQEGKGIGGTSTQGRTDVTDEEAIERATRGEES